MKTFINVSHLWYHWKSLYIVMCYNDVVLIATVDNSDSPSIVEQLQQGTDCSCIPLFFLVSGSVEYPMPYASCLASCSVVGCCSSMFST